MSTSMSENVHFLRRRCWLCLDRQVVFFVCSAALCGMRGFAFQGINCKVLIGKIGMGDKSGPQCHYSAQDATWQKQAFRAVHGNMFCAGWHVGRGGPEGCPFSISSKSAQDIDMEPVKVSKLTRTGC